MSTPSIILLAGTRGVGKDTFFTLLNKARPNQFRRYAFADVLKDDLDPISLKMFGKRTRELSGRDKEILRPTLIGYGCGWRAIDPLHWVKIVADQIDYDRSMLDGLDGCAPTWIPCCCDVRFSNEAGFFISRYGRENVSIVNICREGAPEPTDEEKINAPEVAKLADYVINWETTSSEGARMKHVNAYLESQGL